ncbi:MAG: hypothetical protein LUH07_08105 [Lachnospiraceae bacterium]|nr:hypothetical protein [Lachnospiraceae bacterium]
MQTLAKNGDLCAKMGIPEGFKPVSAAALGYSLSGAHQRSYLSLMGAVFIS